MRVRTLRYFLILRLNYDNQQFKRPNWNLTYRTRNKNHSLTIEFNWLFIYCTIQCGRYHRAKYPLAICFCKIGAQSHRFPN